ncbi:MAG TPA: hypothetical protein VI759_05520 [Dehalococcoidia bacterium]|nr:hypothetical protein [Dehalococcoidia bacterium]
MLALLLMLLVACNGGGKENSPDPKQTEPAVATATTPAAQGTPAGGATVVSVDPLIKDEPVAFETDDGQTVRGHLYGVAGPKARVIIWAVNDGLPTTPALIKSFVSPGVDVLQFDFRRDISKIDHDLDAAVRFMKFRDYPRVYIVGVEEYGAAGLKVAAKEDLAGIVVISPILNATGQDPRADLANIKEPKLFIASSGDPSAAAVALLMQSSPDPKQSKIFEGNACCMAILQNIEAARQLILDFIKK